MVNMKEIILFLIREKEQKKREKSQIFVFINMEGGKFFLKGAGNFDSSWSQKFVLWIVFFLENLKEGYVGYLYKKFQN